MIQRNCFLSFFSLTNVVVYPSVLCLVLQRRTVLWITVGEEVTTVTLLSELSAATPAARRSSAPACRASRVTAGCVGVSRPGSSARCWCPGDADIRCYDFRYVTMVNAGS